MSALDGLAKNPALPPHLIRRLIHRERGFGEVARRADLTPDLVDEIFAAGRPWLLHSLALNRQATRDVRRRLAEEGDDAVRKALAVNGPNPRDVLEILLADPHPPVRSEVAHARHVPADLLARLADDPEPEVRATLARSWVEAPEDVRRKLLTDPDDSVRAHACSTYYSRLPHPVPPADLVPGLLDDPLTRAGAVLHAPIDLVRGLVSDPDATVRCQLAAHPMLPPDLRDRLAEDVRATVRLAVFARQDTPEALRATIHAGLPDSRFEDVPDDLDDDAAIAAVEDSLIRIELRWLRLEWVTADPMPYVASPYPCFRASAARGEKLPADVVRRLLDDEESDVREVMFRHALPDVGPDTAERIDRHYRPPKPSPWRPADDYTFPLATLERLATDPDRRMRVLATRDAGLAARLTTDPDAWVRTKAAAHPDLPVAVLLPLLDSENAHVAEAAGAHPSLPVAEMERLLRGAGL